jgi:Protein of unknown function (DUF2637)
MRGTADIPWVAASDQAVGVITCLATLAALGLSYRGLYDFATQHGGYPRWAAAIFPLIIDSFVVLGELRLFSATLRKESVRIKLWAWTLTLGGLIVSMAGNVAHVGLAATWDMKLAAAAAPLAAAASLTTGLGILKLNARQEARQDGGGDRGAAPDRERGPAVAVPASRPAPVSLRAQAWSRVAAGSAAYDEALADLEAGRTPKGKSRLAAAHGISEHHARVALEQARRDHAAQSNGHRETAGV